MTHYTHKTRYSDSSHYDELCINCGATDGNLSGLDALNSSCPCPDAGAEARRLDAIDRAEAATVYGVTF